MRTLILSLLLVVASAGAQPSWLAEPVTLATATAVDDQDTTTSAAFRIELYDLFTLEMTAIENTGNAHLKVLYGISLESVSDVANADDDLFAWQNDAGVENIINSDFTQTALSHTPLAINYGMLCKIRWVGLATNGSDIDITSKVERRRKR